MKRKSQWIAGLFLLAATALSAGDKRILLLPKLLPGQTVTYLIRFQSNKLVKTESTVVMPLAPNAAQLDAHGLLRIEILDVQSSENKSSIHARARFLTLDSGVWVKKPDDRKPDWDIQRVDPDAKNVEFTISADGSVINVIGLDSLFPEQQQAWRQCVARFALAWTLPANGVKFGEKWKPEQSEQAGAPIAGLRWTRDSRYVKDESCQARQLSISGDVTAVDGPPDTCAVLLTTSILKQKSSSKDATPDDFKLHELRTRGTAKGTSEIITYISLKTGLVVRATEETSQLMDVVVAKADGSNRVRYNVDAKSHSEVLLVTEMRLTQH